MLYIKIFFQSILDDKFKGFVFVLTIFLGFLILNLDKEIQSKITNYFRSDEKAILSLLVKSQDMNLDIINEIKSINEVKAIQEANLKNVISNVQKEFEDNGLSLSGDVFLSDYRLFEIFLSNTLTTEEHEVVLSKLKSIMLTADYTLSKIKKPYLSSKENPTLVFFLKWVSQLLFFFFVLLHLMISRSFFNVLKARVYLYKSFQRQNNLLWKVIGFGLISLTAISMGVSIFYAKDFDLFSNVIFLGLILILSFCTVKTVKDRHLGRYYK